MVQYKKNRHKSTDRKKYNKRKNQKLYFLLPFICVILIATYLITLSIHPIGVIEYIKSTYTSVGYGKGYDIDINNARPLYTLSDDDRYFVVSSNYVNCYNRNGKTIFEKNHSLSEPVVKFSETRYLLYGQGERNLQVNSFSNTLYSHNFSSGIITAAISDSGVFAVATKSDGYSSSVAVYNKNNEKIFEWFSSDETVNTLALASNGKSIAVSTIKVEKGKYISSFYVLKFNSADPVFKKTYTDNVIYQLIPTNNTTYCLVFADNIEFVNYKSEKAVTNKSDYSVSIVKQIDGKIIAVRTVAANHDESLIEIYNQNGKIKSSFKVNIYITDFSYSSNKIYVLGLHDIYKYNSKGKLDLQTKADYDVLFIEAVSANSVACIRNSLIDKYELKQTEAS